MAAAANQARWCEPGCLGGWSAKPRRRSQRHCATPASYVGLPCLPSDRDWAPGRGRPARVAGSRSSGRHMPPALFDVALAAARHVGEIVGDGRADCGVLVPALPRISISWGVAWTPDAGGGEVLDDRHAKAAWRNVISRASAGRPRAVWE